LSLARAHVTDRIGAPAGFREFAGTARVRRRHPKEEQPMLESTENDEERERGTDTASDPEENPAGDIGGQGGEGSEQEETTPEIGEEGEKGQTGA
jgi:hypothetical protein